MFRKTTKHPRAWRWCNMWGEAQMWIVILTMKFWIDKHWRELAFSSELSKFFHPRSARMMWSTAYEVDWKWYHMGKRIDLLHAKFKGPPFLRGSWNYLFSSSNCLQENIFLKSTSVSIHNLAQHQKFWVHGAGSTSLQLYQYWHGGSLQVQNISDSPVSPINSLAR